jgi:asparagine synthase (glutamine-hydrolysing)
MIGALQHRGPDESGLFRDDRVSLGHARLSIIDVATGQQPMRDVDDTTWLVFNGEIFNYIELREELLTLGARFRTRSDTEVILQAFRAWGEAAFPRFDGQFALAIWEPGAERLSLARDRFGVRPLYLARHEGRLYFASEVKAIFAGAPGMSRAIDPLGLAETFTFWSTVAPQGIFEGITELEPGHVRTYTRAGVTDRPFWSIAFERSEAIPASIEASTERVRGALEEAVRLRILRADVPVGCYLSGGLDSSIIAALGRRAIEGEFRTFSIRFEDAEYDETPWQRMMARTLDADHEEVMVTRRDIVDAFPEVVRHAERPLLRTAPAPMYLLSRRVHDSGIKVVLTGEGADELFAGYDLFREAAVRRFWGREPSSEIRPRLLDRLYPYLVRSPVGTRTLAREYLGRDRGEWQQPGFGHRTRWSSTAALQPLFSAEMRAAAAPVDVVGRLLDGLPPTFRDWDHLSQDQYLEIRTLLAGYLLSSQGDRMLMAHSVEGRFPFLDTEVAAAAMAIPPSHRLLGLQEKRVLKRVARDLVPLPIIERPKQPYRAPDALAFTLDPPDWMEAMLQPGVVRTAGIFDPNAVQRLWRKCRAAAYRGQLSNADNMALVGVISTALLHNGLVHEPPVAARPVALRTIVDRTTVTATAGREPTMSMR